MKYLILIIIICIGLSTFGQTKHDLNCQFKQLFLMGDMDTWAILVDSLQNSTLSISEDDILLYAEYGLIGFYMSNERFDEAKIMLDYFDDHIDRQLELHAENAIYHSFKAAAYGFKIGLSPWKAPFLSVYHQYQIDMALKFQKKEILPIIEQANSYYFRPRIVGGNKQKALNNYEKANQMLQHQKECNWTYYSNTAWLGQVYTKLKMEDKAKLLYLKILNEEPNFKYVKVELLPQLESGEFKDVGGSFEKLFD